MNSADKQVANGELFSFHRQVNESFREVTVICSFPGSASSMFQDPGTWSIWQRRSCIEKDPENWSDMGLATGTPVFDLDPSLMRHLLGQGS